MANDKSAVTAHDHGNCGLCDQQEKELDRLRAELDVKSEFLSSRQCSDHSGKWERGRCLQCEIERLRQDLDSDDVDLKAADKECERLRLERDNARNELQKMHSELLAANRDVVATEATLVLARQELDNEKACSRTLVNAAVIATERTERAEAALERQIRQNELDSLRCREMIATAKEWLDNNTTYYNVDADWPVEGHNIPVLAQVSKRIWYHATDDETSYPFSAVLDRALAEKEGK